MIAEPVDAGRYRFDAGAVIGKEVKAVEAARDQTEPVVLVCALADGFQVRPGVIGADEVIARELSAGARPIRAGMTETIIRDRCEAAVLRDAQPGSALLEIASTVYVRMIRPESGGGGGTAVRFVAVRRDDERIARVRTCGEQDQAHRATGI